jgi:hypothetical protein
VGEVAEGTGFWRAGGGLDEGRCRFGGGVESAVVQLEIIS